MSSVIGLDLSLTATGISDGTTTRLITSKGKKGDSIHARNARLKVLVSRIIDDVKDIAPDAQLVVVEGPSFASVGGHHHDRSGLWWLTVSRLMAEWFQVVEVPPTVLKRYATGKGNANKGAMIEAATRRFPHVETGGDDNRCDALFLAALGHQHLGTPLVTMPAAHLTVMDSVRWPEQVPA